jgi:hypothetical protein
MKNPGHNDPGSYFDMTHIYVPISERNAMDAKRCPGALVCLGDLDNFRRERTPRRQEISSRQPVRVWENLGHVVQAGFAGRPS